MWVCGVYVWVYMCGCMWGGFVFGVCVYGVCIWVYVCVYEYVRE